MSVAVSRIVTLYNQWEFLDWLDDDALFAPETTFVLIDDASTQPPPDRVLARIRARGILLHRLPRNVGRARARNAGADLAASEWIEFVDGDDRPLPLDPRPLAGGAELGVFPVRVHGARTDELAPPVRCPLLVDARAPGGYVDPRPAALAWRRPTFLALGGFDPRAEPVEDLDLALRARHLPRAYATQPKQSYNEQPSPTLKGLESVAALARLYARLPASEPQRDALLDEQLRNLHLHATWHLRARGHRAFLRHAALSQLWHGLKARLSSRRPPS